MTTEKLLRGVAKQVYLIAGCKIPDELDAEWEKAGENWQQNCYGIARRIHNLYKEAGYMQLSDDQSLPNTSGVSNLYEAGMIEAQQDMVNAGFRKIKQEV